MSDGLDVIVVDDAGFGLSISGSPKYYEPGNLYTVNLKVQTIFAIQSQTLEKRSRLVTISNSHG